MWIDIVIISLCVLTVIIVPTLTIINKKKGKPGCGCNCLSCANCSKTCPSKDKNIKS